MKKVHYRNKCLHAIALVCFYLLNGSHTWAARLTEAEVRSAVETWVRFVTADAKPGASITRMEPYIRDGETYAFIAHLSGKGFCLCGADDLALPVYLYNPRGNYEDDPEAYAGFLEEIYYRTKDYREGILNNDPVLQGFQKEVQDRAQLWNDLTKGIVKDQQLSKYSTKIDTLQFTAMWHQNSPYNASCPQLPTGETTIVGCGAISLSQVLYYWKWPEKGTGAGQTNYNWSYRTDWDSTLLLADPGISGNFWSSRLQWINNYLYMSGYWDASIYDDAKGFDTSHFFRNSLAFLYNRLTDTTVVYSVNFGNNNYNMDILLDNHTGSTNANSNAEVAKLCHHAGVSINMNYGISASGADPDDVAPALKDHWGYDNDAVLNDRDTATMTRELRWLRPIIFRGRTDSVSSKGVGHLFNVYGYNSNTDPNRQFLMNMGWGPGFNHLWYTVDNINTTSGNFKYLQKHVTRIAPADSIRFVGNTTSGDGSPANPYKDLQEAVADSADIPHDAVLIFETDSENTFSSPELILDFPVYLRGRNAILKKE